MNITDDAKQLLQKIDSEGIRLFTVSSSNGPQITLSMDKPQQFDRIQMINGIKVAFDPAVTGTEILTLDKEENEDGVGFVLLVDDN